MWVVYTPYKLFNCSRTVLGCRSKRSTIPSKEPPAEISGYGPALQAVNYKIAEFKRHQVGGESTTDFMAELHQIVNFSDYLESAIQD